MAVYFCGTTSIAQRRLGLVAVFVSMALAGCGGAKKVVPLEPAKARDALKTALDEWKAGKAAESLQQLSPPVHIADGDWVNGAKLQDYAILSEGEAAHNKLNVPVRLTLQPSSGAKTEKTVIYFVSTGPSIAIVRDMMQQ